MHFFHKTKLAYIIRAQGQSPNCDCTDRGFLVLFFMYTKDDKTSSDSVQRDDTTLIQTHNQVNADNTMFVQLEAW